MEKTIVWKAATDRFLIEINGGVPDLNTYNGFYIKHHSGLTTYIMQGVYPDLNSAYKNSSWYKAIKN
jgi:hypothetical protein